MNKFYLSGKMNAQIGQQSFKNVLSTLFIALGIAALSAVFNVMQAQTVQVLTTGTSYTVPAGVTTITVECWGGGGGGGFSSNAGQATGGGGGGAYAKKTLSVTPGQVISYAIGGGGTGTSGASAGGDTWFGATTTVLAKGGGGVANNSATGGTGGSAATSVGDITRSGGNGGNSSGSGACAAAGGGGGAAGANANGGNGSVGQNGTDILCLSGGTGGTGGAGQPPIGGNGGTGTNSEGAGSAGSVYGGGGGGGKKANICIFCSNQNGGNGAAGAIRITYCTTPVNVSVLPTSSGYCTPGGTPVTLTASSTEPNYTLTEGFNSGTGTATYTPAGWGQNNASSPVGLTNWFNGNTTVFGPNSGSGYIAANFNGTTGNNTISNWLFLPNLILNNGDVLTFYTRTVDAPAFPDRLQVRMSTNGASSNIGSGSAAVGDFTTLLLDINPSLTTSGYPNTWTQFTVTLSGLSGPTSGKIAFRYFVTSGGPSGSNSDYIGIDDVVYTSGSNQIAFSWSPSTGLSATAGASVTASPTITTTYTVTATSLITGCTGTATTTVTVAPLAISPSATPPSSCGGQNVILNAGITGGGAPYSYTWNNGVSNFSAAANPTVSPATTTTYFVTVTDGCGGLQTGSVTVNVAPALNISVSPPSATFCAGGTPIMLTVNGIPGGTAALSEGFNAGGGLLTYTPPGWFQQNNSGAIGSTNWFDGNTTVFPPNSGTGYIGANFNNAAGNNTISNWLLTPNITLNNGDVLTFYTRTVDVPTFPDRLQVRMSTNGASTNVGATATDVGDFTTLLLDINPTLTTSGYPNTWTQFTVTISGLGGPTSGRLAFRYFVTGGGPSGSNSDYIGIDDVVYNSSSSYSINWGPSSGLNTTSGATVQASPAANTTYTVTVTNLSSGCTATASTVVNVANLSLSPSASPATICSGENTQLSAGAANGEPPYTYTWNDGASNFSAEALPTVSPTTTTTYSVTVNDACGTPQTGAVTVIVNALPNVTVSPNEATYCPPAGAPITLTASAPGQSVTLFSEGFDSGIVPPTGWAQQNNSSPVGVTNWFDGNLTVFEPNSGAGYIGANFNNTTGANTISNWLLTPNITLNNGDVFTFYTRTTIGSIWPDRLQVRMSTNGASTDVGATNASVGDFTTLLLDINPTLAVGGYPEAWTQYSVTIAGLGGATSGRLAFRYFVTNGGPSGSNSDYIGIDDVVYSTGSSFTYLWSPSDGLNTTSGATVNASPLATTTYTVTVTNNATGCSATASATVAVSPPLSIAPTASPALVCGGQPSVLNANVSGGTPPFSYVWNNGISNFSTDATPTVFPTSNTTFFVTVTDVCGSVTGSVTVNASLLNATVTVSNFNGFAISCNGGNNGSVTITPSGGTTPYNYAWSNGVSGSANSISGLTAGFYVVTITDANGCQVIKSFLLNQPPALNCSATVSNVTCNGQGNGSITVNGGGGVAPLNYTWNGPGGPYGNTGSLTGLSGGVYNLTITDANDCVCTNTFTVVEPPAIVPLVGSNVSEGNGNPPSFFNVNTITFSGGTAPYYYSWNITGYVTYSIPSPGTIQIVYADNATWSVTISDGNGCGGENLVFSNVPGAGGVGIVNIFSSAITPDSGTSNGAISLTVIGGILCPGATYQYQWEGPANWLPAGNTNSPNLSNLPSGWYIVTVSDCSSPTPQFTVGWFWVPKQTRGRGKAELALTLSSDNLQIYPNPFEKETALHFTLPETAHATLAVYDLSGKEVKVLYSGLAQGNEPVTVQLPADGLPAGSYFCRLSVKEWGESVQKQVILTR